MYNEATHPHINILLQMMRTCHVDITMLLAPLLHNAGIDRASVKMDLKLRSCRPVSHCPRNSGIIEASPPFGVLEGHARVMAQRR